MPWDETDEYIRSGHRDPSDFQPNTFRTITLDEERGIKAIVAKPKGSDKMEIQSYLFSKSKGWTLEKAKEWFEAHKSEAVDQQSTENPSTPAQSAEAQARSQDRSTESGSKQSQSQAKVESFRWAEGIFKPIRDAVEEGGGRVWRARVLHAGTTRNNVKFTRDELIRAARSLSLRPVNINHPALGLSAKARWLPYPQNMVLRAEFEDDAIEALLLISDPEVNKMIEEGEINALSVEWTALKEHLKDGVKPEGVVFPALALLTKDMPPGDPLASIIRGKAARRVEAVWSREYINDLPDEAFAVILPGGKKDERGKTTPRSLRKFPHHNKDVKSGEEHDTVDLPHLRNALARLPQSKIPQKYKDQAREHLEKHAKALKIGEYREGAEQLLEETVEEILIDHEERISELEERVEKLEAQRAGEGVALIQEAKTEEKITDVRRPADRILYEKWIRATQRT